jgi:hypothetical protein
MASKACQRLFSKSTMWVPSPISTQRHGLSQPTLSARRARLHQLDLTPPPLALARPKLLALWHPRNRRDEGHLWLRQRLYDAADAV